MSVFVYVESDNTQYKKASLEAVSYAYAIASQKGEEVVALTINPLVEPEILYQYGASKVIELKDESCNKYSARSYAKVLASEANGILILPHSLAGVAIAAMVAVDMNAALLTNVVEIPSSLDPVTVKRKVFSGKAFMIAQANKDNVVISVSVNSFGAHQNPVSGTSEVKKINLADTAIQVQGEDKSTGKLELKEAEIVVSAGRGMKGPENWEMIESLANTLGAATACSKPVSDLGWRPHSEHVGQTGKAIAPNLYIAIGISGAIQHLAGVNSSKTIVVINSDPDAPFFKAADYGVVGDAFQVIPQLIEKIKEVKA